jgi:hypothetical protein
MDCDKFLNATSRIQNILNTKNYGMNFLHSILMDGCIVDMSPITSWAHINWN